MRPHQNSSIEKRFVLSIGLTLCVLIAEVAGGLWTGSLALLSDSAHVFMDIFALVLSYTALRLSALPADDRHTYGYHRLEVLAALANGLTLSVISIGIFWESYQRWLTPVPVKSLEMLVIALIGLIVNLGVAIVLRGGQHVHTGEGHEHRDLNVESAFLHVVGDAISSAGVIVAALVLWLTGWLWIDPLVSALIGVMILISSGRVLRRSLHILVEGTPEGISVAQVGQALTSLPGVVEVHDLHVWNICSGRVALSAHLVLTKESSQNSLDTLKDVNRLLSSNYGIEHSTVQIECIACGQGRVYRSVGTSRAGQVD